MIERLSYFKGEHHLSHDDKNRPQNRSHLRSVSTKKKFQLQPAVLVKMHDHMVRARQLEERMIKMYKQSEGYFWLGGPGEEAFQIPLGLQIRRGEGVDYDFLHLHYRSSAILLAMGMNPKDALRQMRNTENDPFSGGRNFVNHCSIRKSNVVPITSTIETQYATAIGTGIAQLRHGGKGMTIVTGGDAGTAEGEFQSCLIWASRPGEELPMLIIVTNNEYGISTPANTQHGEANIADRAKPYGIKCAVINGNDVEESWFAIKEAMEYIRTERKPYFIEARVSRLYGHSSASGANFVCDEEDPIVTFETQLLASGILTRKQMDEVRDKHAEEIIQMAKEVKTEKFPDGSTIYDHTYWQQKGKYW